MRKKIGTFLMIIGVLLVLGALGLLVYNRQEAVKAQKNTEQLLPRILAEIESKKQEKEETEEVEEVPELPQAWEEFMDKEPEEMPVVELDGQKYIGYLSIPSLQLDLPVMSDWSYQQLKQAPCRYSGNVSQDNLVVMAHNYEYHFGGLKDLSQGENIFFTDMNGEITIYEVVARDILNPVAIEEVTENNYDLTLFTCTYGGQSRVTVYCNRAKGN